METNSIIRPNEKDISESQLKKIKMEMSEADGMSNDLMQKNSGMNNNDSKRYDLGMVEKDELLFILNSVPRKSKVQIKTLSESKDFLCSEMKQYLKKESEEELKKYLKKESEEELKKYWKKESEEELKSSESGGNGNSPLNMSIKLEVKSYDLKQEPKEEDCLVDSSLGPVTKSDEAMTYDNKSGVKQIMSYNSFKYEETSLDKIPKHVLGNYGIVLVEQDMFNSPEPKDVSDSDDEDFEYHRRLVIDEEEKDDKTEQSSEDELPGTKKESTDKKTGFTSTGHHLVISSVKTLKLNKHCPICDIVFPGPDSFEIHRKKHCPFIGCPEFIENESDMEKHVQIHKDHPLKPFRCDVCKKRFHYYRFAQKHREMCSTIRRIKCPHCSYSSSKIRKFNKHVAKHLDNVSCTDCRKTYTMVKKFSEHVSIEHRKRVLFQCTECPRRFQMPERIISHIQVHKLNITDCGMSRFIMVQSADQS